jgi:hypothetical protein
MHCQEDDLRIRIVFADFSRGFDSIEQGHADVGHDCVRLQLVGGRNQLGVKGMASPFWKRSLELLVMSGT